MEAFWNLLLGRLILPDIEMPPKQILDIGCGSGIYCMELAHDLPYTHIHGVDIFPLQHITPPANCQFYVADVLEGLPFPDQQFDFIHSRDIHSGIPPDKWVPYLTEVYRLLRPGGWLQLAEMDPWPACDDGTLRPDSAWIRYLVAMNEISDQSNIKVFGLGPELRGYVEEAGFVNITETCKKCPLGKWTKGITYCSWLIVL